jgi:hypothetical protein
MNTRALILAAVLLSQPLSASAGPLSCPFAILGKALQTVGDASTNLGKKLDKPESASAMAAKLELTPELAEIVKDINKRKEFEEKLRTILLYKTRVERRKGYNNDWEPQSTALARKKVEQSDDLMSRGHAGVVYDMVGEHVQKVIRNTYEIRNAERQIAILQNGKHSPEQAAFVNKQIAELEEMIVVWKEGVGEEIDGFRFIVGHLRSAVDAKKLADAADSSLNTDQTVDQADATASTQAQVEDSSQSRYLDSARRLFERLGIDYSGSTLQFRANGEIVTLEEIDKTALSLDAQIGRWRQMAQSELFSALNNWSLSFIRAFSGAIGLLPAELAVKIKSTIGLLNETLLQKLYGKKLNDVLTAPLEKNILIELVEKYAKERTKDEFLLAFAAQVKSKYKERWILIRKMAEEMEKESTLPIERTLHARMLKAQDLAATSGYLVSKPAIAAAVTITTSATTSGIYLLNHPNALNGLMHPVHQLSDAAGHVLHLLSGFGG